MIDSHAHLDLPVFDPDREAVLARAAEVGVVGVLIPAIRPATWETLLAMCARPAPCASWPALGVHPQIVPHLDADERALALSADALANAMGGRGAVAVGECGLDGGTGEPDTQEAVLRAHVRAARALGLPLCLHVLRAHDRALRILREEKVGEVGGVLHSYSGGAALVPAYMDLGLSFSLAGPVTYARARRPVEAARAIPPALLLAETDAPDQTPVPHQGSRCEPAFVREVVKGLAAARGESETAVAHLITENAKRLFRLR